MNWRHLLTVQSPVVHEIPEDCTSVSSYVEEFERLNHLVPTGSVARLMQRVERFFLLRSPG